MSRAIELSTEMMKVDFDQIARHEADPAARVRAIILSHIVSGKTRNDAAVAVGMDRSTVREVIKRVNEYGLEGLYDRPRYGRPSVLSFEKRHEFRANFLDAQNKKTGGRLTGYDAQEMLATLGIKFKLTRVYDVLHECNLSWVSSRSAHPKRDEAAQAAFKKTLFKKSKVSCRQT